MVLRLCKGDVDEIQLVPMRDHGDCVMCSGCRR